MRKRILSLTLVFSMLATLIVALPTTVSAASSGTCGDNLIWVLDTDGTLTISGTGDMEDYNAPSFYAPWFTVRDKIKTIKIHDGVTSIADTAFTACSKAITITIPDSVTYIGSFAFDGCNELTELIIPIGVISIGNYAFNNCLSLKKIMVEEENCYYSSDEYGILYDKDKTQLINCPVNILQTNIMIPSSVININNQAFYCCRTLTNVILPNEITSIGVRVFAGCSNLTNIVIPEGVTDIGSFAFADCSNLSSITISKSVSSIGNGAFEGCGALTEIDIPDGVIEIKEFAFQNCKNLRKISIPSSVTSIGMRIFLGCNILESISVSDNNPYYSSDEYGMLYNKDQTSIIQCPMGIAFNKIIIPNTVTYIEGYSFENCSELQTVIMPNSVESIGRKAFYGCSELKNLVIGKNVIYIDLGAFYGCNTLSNVHYCGNKQEWENIDIGYMNDNLLNANIEYKQGYYIVDNGSCGDNLTWTLDNDGVLTISGTGKMYDYNYSDWETDAPWFAYKSSIKSVVITDGVTGIGQNAFWMCRNLAEISLPDGIEYIGEYAFEYTKFFDDMKNWEDGLLYIGNYLIAYRGETYSCVIKDGTECLAELSLYKQWYDYIVIPASVKYIGNSAFYGCEISTVYYAGTQEQWSDISVGSENETLKNAKIECKTITNDGNLKVKDLDITTNTIKFSVEPKESESDNVVYIGIYDNLGKLISVKSYPTSECDRISLKNEGNTLKVMWLGEENFQPLADRIKINIKN